MIQFLVFMIFYFASIEDNIYQEYSIIYPILIIILSIFINPIYSLILLVVFFSSFFINNRYIGNGDLFFLVLVFLFLPVVFLLKFCIYMSLLSLLNIYERSSAMLFPIYITYLYLI